MRGEGFLPSAGQVGCNLFDTLKLLNPSLVLLNRRVPQDDGFSLLARIRMNRETNTLPVIFTCDQEDETDQVVAFRLGANDVVSKSVSPRVLAARIRVQLRMNRADHNFRPQFPDRQLQVGDLLLDFWSHQAVLAGASLPLTLSEFILLAELAKKPGTTVNRKELATALGKTPENRSLRRIDSHIKALRQKLGNSGLVQTIRGKGYRINPEIPRPANST